MARNTPTLLLLAAGLSAAAGCSRTYDGTVVPTYRMTLDRYAGIPILTMQRTPLEEPRPAGGAQAALAVFPPPPASPPVATDAAPVPARAIEPAKPRPRGVPLRRVASKAPPTAEKPLVCRSGQSAERAVSVVCE